MTLAISAAPLNSERRDTSVSGTRAVVSSQQLIGSSEPGHRWRAVSSQPYETLRAARLSSRVEAYVVVTLFVAAPVGTATLGSADRLDGCSSEEYARIGLRVQCINGLTLYAILR